MRYFHLISKCKKWSVTFQHLLTMHYIVVHSCKCILDTAIVFQTLVPKYNNISGTWKIINEFRTCLVIQELYWYRKKRIILIYCRLRLKKMITKQCFCENVLSAQVEQNRDLHMCWITAMLLEANFLWLASLNDVTIIKLKQKG